MSNGSPYTGLDTLRRRALEAWARALTHAHTRWLVRRDKSPWLYVLPLAVTVTVLGPH